MHHNAASRWGWRGQIQNASRDRHVEVVKKPAHVVFAARRAEGYGTRNGGRAKGKRLPKLGKDVAQVGVLFTGQAHLILVCPDVWEQLPTARLPPPLPGVATAAAHEAS